jgi:hypothetical protein
VNRHPYGGGATLTGVQTSMVEDDHYIVNSRNAHIDTSAFEMALLERLSSGNGGVEETLECIYDFAFSRTNITPKEPADHQLICLQVSVFREVPAVSAC